MIQTFLNYVHGNERKEYGDESKAEIRDAISNCVTYEAVSL